MARFHLYTPKPGTTSEIVRAVRITRDRNVPANQLNNYTFRAGISDKGRVDWLGTFDGASRKMVADIPVALFENLERPVRPGQSVVLDVIQSGFPFDLVGTTVQTETAFDLQAPPHRISDPVFRASLDALGDWVRAIRAGEQVHVLALPRRINDPRYSYAAHDHDENPQLIELPGFADGQVALTLGQTQGNALSAIIVASASFSNNEPTPSTLAIAIGDGTTNQGEQQQTAVATPDMGHMSTSYAVDATGGGTYTLRLRAVAGSGNVMFQTISALVTEV